MQIIRLILAVMLMAAATTFTGCTTANYGSKPTAVENEKDTYKFRVYVGGFAGPETAFNQAKVDIEDYQKTNGYKAYKVIGKEYNPIPSYFEYTVQFRR